MTGRSTIALVSLVLASIVSCSGPPKTVVSSPGPPSGFTLTQPASPVGVGPTGVAPDTPIFVTVVRSIDSAQGTLWNPAPPDAFMVTYDVIDAAGNVRIAAGTMVQATVNAQPRRRLGQQGTIVIGLRSTSTVDGLLVPLDGSYKWDGIDRQNLTIGLTVGMIVVYPFLNFLHLLMRGGDVVVPAGSVLSAVVAPA